MKKPKFKVGQVVFMKDAYNFNPCYKTISIGKVEAIHIQTGEEIGHNPKIKNFPKKYYPEKNNQIIYTVSGFGLMPREKQLKLYKEKK